MYFEHLLINFFCYLCKEFAMIENMPVRTKKGTDLFYMA